MDKENEPLEEGIIYTVIFIQNQRLRDRIISIPVGQIHEIIMNVVQACWLFRYNSLLFTQKHGMSSESLSVMNDK